MHSNKRKRSQALNPNVTNNFPSVEILKMIESFNKQIDKLILKREGFDFLKDVSIYPDKGAPKEQSLAQKKQALLCVCKLIDQRGRCGFAKWLKDQEIIDFFTHFMKSSDESSPLENNLIIELLKHLNEFIRYGRLSFYKLSDAFISTLWGYLDSTDLDLKKNAMNAISQLLKQKKLVATSQSITKVVSFTDSNDSGLLREGLILLLHIVIKDKQFNPGDQLIYKLFSVISVEGPEQTTALEILAELMVRGQLTDSNNKNLTNYLIESVFENKTGSFNWIIKRLIKDRTSAVFAQSLSQTSVQTIFSMLDGEDSFFYLATNIINYLIISNSETINEKKKKDYETAMKNKASLNNRQITVYAKNALLELFVSEKLSEDVLTKEKAIEIISENRQWHTHRMHEIIFNTLRLYIEATTKNLIEEHEFTNEGREDWFRDLLWFGGVEQHLRGWPGVEWSPVIKSLIEIGQITKENLSQVHEYGEWFKNMLNNQEESVRQDAFAIFDLLVRQRSGWYALDHMLDRAEKGCKEAVEKIIQYNEEFLTHRVRWRNGPYTEDSFHGRLLHCMLDWAENGVENAHEIIVNYSKTTTYGEDMFNPIAVNIINKIKGYMNSRSNNNNAQTGRLSLFRRDHHSFTLQDFNMPQKDGSNNENNNNSSHLKRE